jgi:hypothetical protein
MAGVGAAHPLCGGLAAGRARTDIQRRVPDHGAGAQHVPHVGVGAAQQVGVGRGRTRGANLIRAPVQGVRSHGDSARVVVRASRPIGVPRSADLRQGLRTECRPCDPAVAGLVPSPRADRRWSRGRLTSATLGSRSHVRVKGSLECRRSRDAKGAQADQDHRGRKAARSSRSARTLGDQDPADHVQLSQLHRPAAGPSHGTAGPARVGDQGRSVRLGATLGRSPSERAPTPGPPWRPRARARDGPSPDCGGGPQAPRPRRPGPSGANTSGDSGIGRRPPPSLRRVPHPPLASAFRIEEGRPTRRRRARQGAPRKRNPRETIRARTRQQKHCR